MTRQTVIAIERGRYSPSLELAFQIARVFAVPLGRSSNIRTVRTSREITGLPARAARNFPLTRCVLPVTRPSRVEVKDASGTKGQT
jgi:DNA-binding XRE family transcriptional regulator